MDKFLKELMDLITIEANNGDYYLDGYVPGYKLDELINKYFPEYEFTSNNTFSQWYPRKNSPLGNIPLLQDIYNKQIMAQLEPLKLFRKDNPNG